MAKLPTSLKRNRRNSEPEHSIAADSRRRAERRGADCRRANPAGRRAADQRGAPPSAKTREVGRRGGFLKQVLILAALVVGGLVLGCFGWMHLFPNQAKAFVQKHVKISLANVSVDWASLRQPTCKGTLHFKIENALPVGITLEHLDYSLLINGMPVGKGLQVRPREDIPRRGTGRATISFEVDPALTKRAMAKTAQERMPKMLGSILEQLKGKKGSPVRELAGTVRVDGNVTFRLLFGQIPLPISQSREFSKES